MPAYRLVKKFLLRRNFAYDTAIDAPGLTTSRRSLLECMQAHRGAAPALIPALQARQLALGQRQAQVLNKIRGIQIEDDTLASGRELSEFLIAVERRAYKQARYAVRDEQAALDIVQDAMLKLSEKYGARPGTELPMLFQRILQNTIRDYYRRSKVRSTWITQLSSMLSGKSYEEDADPLETMTATDGAQHNLEPPDHLEKSQLIVLIENELKKLPARQREAFLLRYWEEMDVAETARAMGCSEGSVKTHCSRAAHTLAAALKSKGVAL